MEKASRPKWRLRRWTLSAGEGSHADLGGAQGFLEPLLPGPFLRWATRVEVQRGETAFGEGVAGEVRLAQQEDPGDPARAREDVPDRFIRGVQVHFLDHAGEEADEIHGGAKPGGIASVGVHDPFGSERYGFQDSRELSTRPAGMANPQGRDGVRVHVPIARQRARGSPLPRTSRAMTAGSRQERVRTDSPLWRGPSRSS